MVTEKVFLESVTIYLLFTKLSGYQIKEAIKMEISQFSSRGKKILTILINQNDYITAKEIAAELKVSERTISREIASLKNEINVKSELDIISKPSLGTIVTGPDDLLEKYKKILQEDQSFSEYSPEGRLKYIIKEFIFSNRYQKLTALAHQLAVTEATISYDLNKVELWFKKRGLKLNRKQGIGIFLKGSEENFRSAVIDFLYEDFGEEKVLEMIRNNIDEPLEAQNKESQTKLDILNYISLDTSNKIEEEINKILAENNFKMVNSSYIGLLIHLALAVKRLENNEKIIIETEKLEKLKKAKEFKLAAKIADQLEKIFGIAIPEDEKAFITMHLKGAKIRKNLEMIESPLEDEELEAIKLARMLVREVENRLNLNLADDYKLISGLTTHLEPAVSRLKMKMEIRNPILKDLKKEYSDIFAITKEAASVIAKELDCSIPDSEIGYLTMHIASALENKNFYFKKIKTLIVCSSGIGSSRILAARLKTVPFDLEIKAEISALNIEKYLDKNQIDLIISTVPLTRFSEKTVVVSPLLGARDIKKIENKIKKININSSNQDKADSEFIERETFEEKLILILKISDDILQLIKNFKIIEFDKIKDYSQVLKKLSFDGYLPESFDPQLVYEALKKREKIGATIVPEMNLGLLHGRTKGVKYPFISLIKLNQSLELNYNGSKKIDRIIVLLAPKKMIKEEINLLSKFSSSIIENENFTKIIKKASKEEFLRYFKKLMESYFNDLQLI